MYREAFTTSHDPNTARMMNMDVKSQGSQIAVASSGRWMAMTPMALLALK